MTTTPTNTDPTWSSTASEWVLGVGIVIAAVLALWRRVESSLAAWLADRADARIKLLESQVSDLRAELAAYRAEINDRDALIREHLAWDHQMIGLLARAGHSDIAPPPPLWPDAS